MWPWSILDSRGIRPTVTRSKPCLRALPAGAVRLVLLSSMTLAGAACASSPARPPPPPTKPVASTAPPPKIVAAPEPTPVQSDLGKAGQKAYRFYLNTVNPKLSGVELIDLNVYFKRGARPLVLSFAENWCEPCRAELAAYAARPGPIKRTGAQYVVVVKDAEPEKAEALVKYLVDDLKLPFPVVLDPTNKISKEYGVVSLPHTTVIGPSGNIAWVESGYTAKKSLRRLLTAIRRARSR